MKTGLEIIVLAKDLQQSLTFARSLIESRNVVDTLTNVKLTAKGNFLEIGATDIDLYLNQKIGAEVIKEGTTTISIHLFNNIIKRISDEGIKLMQQQGSDKLHLTWKNSHFELVTLPADKFPNMENIESDKVVSLRCGELFRMLEYTKFAMSSDETRYSLYGVYLHVTNGKFFSVATDGHRLSLAVSENNINSQDNFGVIIPRKTVMELHKIIKDIKKDEDIVRIIFGENRIKFEIGDIELVSKLIDQNFPEYSNFIPEDNENLMVINRRMLSDSIDRVSSVVMGEKLAVAVKMSISSNFLKISAFGESKGNAVEDIFYSEDDQDYCNYKGEDIIIGVNPRYINEVLGCMKEEKILLFLKDAQSPLVIKSSAESQDIFVIMPVKV